MSDQNKHRQEQEEAEQESLLQLKDWERQAEDSVDLRLDKRQFRRMIWKTRFTIFKSVIVTGLALLFLYAIYMIIVNIVYHETASADKVQRYAITMVNTHGQGMRADTYNWATPTINSLLKQQVELDMYRIVGDWNVKSGKVRATLDPFTGFNYTLDFDSRYLGTNDRFSFAVPPDLLEEGASFNAMDNSSPQIWNRLSRIGDGYVADMSFSTRYALSPEELLAMVERYDLSVLSMPVYGGELKTFKPGYAVRSDSRQWVEHLTLQPPVLFNSEHRQEMASFALSIDNVALAKSTLLDNIAWLLEEGRYNGQDNDRLRLQYMEQHGIKVYGAIVTGPVRELEKLREEQAFYEFQLGQVELWNWSGADGAGG